MKNKNWSAMVDRYIREGRTVSGGSSVSTVIPVQSHTTYEGREVRETSKGKLVLNEGNVKEAIPGQDMAQLIVDSLALDKLQLRMNPDNERQYLTTGQLGFVVEGHGKAWTVSISVNEKAAKKADEFALSPEEQANPQFATILTMRGVIGDFPTKKALRALRGQK